VTPEAGPLLPVVLTPRLRLRCFEAEDAPSLAANLTPPVTRWLGTWRDPVTLEVAAQRIQIARDGVRAGWHVGYGVERLSDGVLIGGFGGDVDVTGEIFEIGYHLAQHAHGQGYMTEAGRAAIAVLWDLLPIKRIEAVAQRENAASFAVMQRLGMSPAGQRLVHSLARDRWEWCGVYGLDRPDL
jgi:ribosomal-protein-alanine N-acetyltransferase